GFTKNSEYMESRACACIMQAIRNASTLSLRQRAEPLPPTAGGGGNAPCSVVESQAVASWPVDACWNASGGASGGRGSIEATSSPCTPGRIAVTGALPVGGAGSARVDA